MATKPKTRAERLFAAAVVRRSFALRGEEHKDAFRFVYEGVLRDLALEARDVEQYLAENQEKVDEAIGRKKA